MINLKKVRIPPSWNSEGRFALCGDAGKTTYHVWINAEYNPDPSTFGGPFVYANNKDYKGTTRRIGINTKLGSQIFASLLEHAKHFELMDNAIKARKAIDAKQAIANASRAEKRKDKERAYNTLVFIAKTMRRPEFSTGDDPCLIELKTKAIAALKTLAL